MGLSVSCSSSFVEGSKVHRRRNLKDFCATTIKEIENLIHKNKVLLENVLFSCFVRISNLELRKKIKSMRENFQFSNIEHMEVDR